MAAQKSNVLICESNGPKTKLFALTKWLHISDKDLDDNFGNNFFVNGSDSKL